MVLDIVGLTLSVPEFILTIISFFLFMFLMKKVLYDPILRVMEERKAIVDEGHEAGKAAEKALSESRARLAAEFAESSGEARALVSQARSEAEREKSAVLGKAHSEVEELHKAVREKIETEERSEEQGLEESLPELVELLTAKLLHTELAAEDKKLISDCTADAEN